MTTESLFWTVVFVGSGGFIVLLGLLMEQSAEKTFFENVKQFRRFKRVRLLGEWFVIIGVFIEVLIAGWTAKEEWRNDPLKKPVASASARVRIIVKMSSNMTPLFVNPEQTKFGWSAGISFFNWKSKNVLLALKAIPDNCASWRMGTTNEQEVRMEFHEDPLNFLEDQSKRFNTLVKQVNNVDSFVLHLPDMETNAEVVSGSVFLIVNDFTWAFDVPHQVTKWGFITMQKTIDSSGKPEAKILRIPISDWVYPPRFTNRWYDGK